MGYKVIVFNGNNEHVEDYLGMHVKETAVREAVLQSRRYPGFTAYVVNEDKPDRAERYERGRRIGKQLPLPKA